MPTLDVFKADAFSMQSLTRAINEFDYVPGRVGSLGIFEEVPVRTTSISIEKRRNTFVLIPFSARGSDPEPNNRDNRVLRSFTVPHIAKRDRIYADEVLNLRAFGSESELLSVQEEMNVRLARLARSVDATIEYGRLQALRGYLIDGDGQTVLLNYYDEFGVSQDSVDFVLGTAGTQIINKVTDVTANIENELGQSGYDHIHALVGYDWWKKFINHAEVKAAYQYWMAQPRMGRDPLTMDLRYRGFTFGDITFEVYRGKTPAFAATTASAAISSVNFINPGEGIAFPVGVPDMYLTHYAPADYVETVNTPGLPRYAKQAADPLFNKWIEVEAQSNPISINTRPKACVKLITSN